MDTSGSIKNIRKSDFRFVPVATTTFCITRVAPTDGLFCFRTHCWGIRRSQCIRRSAQSLELSRSLLNTRLPSRAPSSAHAPLPRAGFQRAGLRGGGPWCSHGKSVPSGGAEGARAGGCGPCPAGGHPLGFPTPGPQPRASGPSQASALPLPPHRLCSAGVLVSRCSSRMRREQTNHPVS